MKNVFLSYSRKNIHQVEDLRQALIQQGYKPWIDPNPRPGQDWRYDIDDAIRAAHALIVVMTLDSANSIYATYEWSFAMGLDIPVFVVVFQPAQMHPRLVACEKFELAAWTDENHFWDYFIREFNRLMAQIPDKPVTASSSASITPQPQQVLSGQAVAPPPVIPTYDKSIMPTAPGYWLVIRRGPKLNQMYKLEKDVVTLGRDVTNDIAINDPEVSRYHLRFLRRGNAYAIEDLGSTNGTQLNGIHVTEVRALNNNDTILLGDAIILSYDVVYG